MDNNIVIRDAEKQDIPALVCLEKLCFPEAWSEDMILSAMNSGTFYIAAFSGEELAGYAAANIVLDEGQVANIALFPAFRGKGLGKTLTKAMIERCFENGCQTVTLEVRHTNAVAIGLYECLGFKTVGKRKDYYRDPKADGILMTLFKEDYNA